MLVSQGTCHQDAACSARGPAPGPERPCRRPGRPAPHPLCQAAATAEAGPSTSGRGALEARDGAYTTFANVEGRVLTPVADGVWAIDRPFLPPLLLGSIDVGGRSVVLQFKNGDLWVHAPLGLDARLKAALAALGPVKHVVTPNYEHTKFAPQWKEAYPEAKLWGCPGMKAKMPGVFDEEVGAGPEPEAWAGEVGAEWLSYERNPFTRSPFFNEVVFLLERQGVLACTDLFWDYPRTRINVGTALWKGGMDRVYRPFYRKFMIGGDPGEYQQRMRRLFEDWDWEGLLPCHGLFRASGGKAALKAHLGLTGLQGL